GRGDGRLDAVPPGRPGPDRGGRGGPDVMSESPTDVRIHLPLVSPGTRAPEEPPGWHGWTPVAPLPETADLAADMPEPVDPQGAYGPPAPEVLLDITPDGAPTLGQPVELLAPAGGPEARS